MNRSCTVGIPSIRVPPALKRSARLWYLYPPHGTRNVGSRQQLRLNPFPLRLKLILQFRRLHPVDSSRPPVAFHRFQRARPILFRDNLFLQLLVPCSPSESFANASMVSSPSAPHRCTVSAYPHSRVGYRSGCARNSSPLIAPVSSSFSSSVLWSFSPSLRRRYSGFFAPTASADFSFTLVKEISPGKVQNLSPRAVWLYLMRLDELSASLFPASLPPAPGLTASFYSYPSRVCCPLLSASPCGYALRFATVAVIGSGWLLSSN